MNKPLMQMTPVEVDEAWSNNTLSEDEVATYTTAKRLAEKGLHGLEPDEIEFAWDRGMINDTDVEKYLDKREAPVLYHIKDVLYGAYAGPRNAVSEGINAVTEIGNWFKKLNTFEVDEDDEFTKMQLALTGGAPEDFQNMSQPDEKIDTSKFEHADTGVGKFVEGTTQFLTGFVPGMKAVKGVGVLSTALKNAPKTLTFLQGMIAGAGADFLVFDPHDARFSDMLYELGIENPVIDWLKADPNDSEMEGRLKNVLEGAGLGVAFEGLFYGLRALKGKIWSRNGNIADRVARDVEKIKKPQIDEGVGKGSPEKVDPEPNVKADSDPVLEDLGQKDVGIADRPVKRITAQAVKEADAIIRMTKGEVGQAGGPIPPRPNFNYIETTQDAFQVMAAIAQKIPEPATRGFKTVEALARHVGGDASEMADNVRNLFGSVQNMDSTIKAVNDYLVTYGEFIAEQSAKAEDLADVLNVASHIQHYSDIMFQVSGAKTEIARALNANKIAAKARRFEWEKIPTEELEKAIKGGDAKKLKKAVKQFADMDTVNKRGVYARNFGRARWLNALLELRQSALVSDVATQAVNIIGSVGTLTANTISHTVSTLAHAPFQPERVHQLGKLYTGLFKGFIEATAIPTKRGDLFNVSKWGKMWQAMINAEPITDALTKYDTTAGAIPGEFRNLFKKGVPWYMHIPLGDVIRLPFRGLTAADEFFKSLAYTQSKYFHSYEKALKMTKEASNIPTDTGLWRGKGDADLFDQMFKTLVAEDSEMHVKGLAWARDMTFTTPMVGLSKKIGDALNHPMGLPFKMLFVPFYNVATNIAKFSLQRTPLGLAGKRFWEDFAAGGVRRTEAFVRMGLGTSLLAAGVWLYQNGRITGAAPKDQRDAWRNAGIYEYSIITNDGRSVQYNRIDPGSMFLGLGADLARLYEEYQIGDKEFEELTTMAIFALSDNIMSKTFMKGAQEAMDVITGRSKIDKWAKRTVSSLTPFSMASQRGQVENDEYLREIYTYRDALIKGSPHWLVDAAKALKPKRHAVYGTPVKKIDRMAGLFNVGEFGNPEDRAVLDMWITGASIRQMTDKFTFAGEQMELDGDEFDKLQSMMERLPVREVLNRVHDEIQGVQDHRTRAEIYSSIVSEFRSAARAMYVADVIENKPEKVDEIIQKVRVRCDGIAGLCTVPDESTRTYHLQNILNNK